MLTNRDITKLKTVFITKDDFNKFRKTAVLKKDLKSMENRMIRKFNDVVDFFDDRVVDHERRIRILEAQNPLTLNG